MTRHRATLIGFIAVILWSLLALLTVGSAPTPPLLLNTICFTIGGVSGLIWTHFSTGLGALRAVPLRVYVFGSLGLFGYHALYFSALRLAPAAEAGLIAYLWPLLIVILSGFLPGERVKKGHLIGATIGFTGAALILSGGDAGFQTAHMAGYLLALVCAFTWSGYSVLSRLVGTAPTQSVTVFCLAAAALSLPLHLIFEQTIFPQTAIAWGSTLLLGMGPVGLAFFVWDIGVKQGDIQLLGTASYAAPLLSTCVLVVAGVTAFSATLGIAAILVTGGAVIAARASLSSRN
ncbi:Aromatic amino acid exporter YddG [Roseobacter fucihabitans]|uniref:Aromatic amino acid exporter YddG n=1 Tax=Roseobacter fucihabitans TaxID=1537242 RepID=A0ABZ2BNP8_9RHOB|nr:EamA family transporter [Roseobacter litoralis]MBC6968096.1 Aromatic amino acid exporter YddG [Roseobacter litoralis]